MQKCFLEEFNIMKNWKRTQQEQKQLKLSLLKLLELQNWGSNMMKVPEKLIFDLMKVSNCSYFQRMIFVN